MGWLRVSDLTCPETLGTEAAPARLLPQFRVGSPDQHGKM